MRTVLRHAALAGSLGAMLFAAGCSFNGREARAKHVDALQSQLADRADAVAEMGPLTLSDCIAIALRNNLQLQSSEIQARIAVLDRKAAFANFLPTVELNYGYTRWDRQPQTRVGQDETGPLFKAMHDRSLRTLSADVTLPILAPSSWFLYAARARGAEIAQLTVEHARQLIMLRVASLYYDCLSLREAAQGLQSQVEAAEAREREAAAFCREGMAQPWEAEQAQALTLARRTDLEDARRAQRQADAQLLTEMGLSPLATLVLAVETPLEAPPEPVEELVLQALIAHPQLHIADRSVAVSRERTRMAIAAFLPRVAGVSSLSKTSDSFARYATAWTMGAAGVLSAFNGFSSVQEYRAAREGEKDAALLREEACLKVMLQVVATDLQVKDTEAEAALAEKELSVAQARLREIERQSQEGLVGVSDRLAAAAALDAAQVRTVMARYRRQTAIAALRTALGKPFAAGQTPLEGDQRD